MRCHNLDLTLLHEKFSDINVLAILMATIPFITVTTLHVSPRNKENENVVLYKRLLKPLVYNTV